MKFIISTTVAGKPREVFAKFTQPLLEALSPPWANVSIRRFDGSKKNDRIVLNVKILGIISQDWENIISDDFESEEECYFTDEGIKMPFPVSYWRHRHRIVAKKAGSEIRDEIEYRCKFLLLEWLFFPVIWIQFVWRRPVYRRYFSKS